MMFLSRDLWRRPAPLLVLCFALAHSLPALAQGGPPGAGVAAILSFESPPELVYAATDVGVFRSDNAGLSWAAKNEGLTNLFVSGIAGTPGVLFAATVGGGVFRSVDGGDHWQAANQGLDDLNVLSLAADPSKPNVLYAGSNAGGIFKSTDGGTGWTSINAGLTEGAFLSIAIDPLNPDTLYAANASATQPGLGSLFKTTNAGGQWSALGAGLVPLSLVIDPSTPSTLYFGTTNGITKSTDGGQTAALVGLQGFVIQGIAVDPRDSKIVYAASSVESPFTARFDGLLKSEDGGETWQIRSAGFPPAEIRAVAVDGADSQRLYAGTSGAGVFRSLDGALNWQLASSGIGGADVQALAINPQAGGEVLAGIAGGSLFQTKNGGESWVEARENLRQHGLRALAYDPQNSTTVYAGTVDPYVQGAGALLRSTNGGAQWEVLADAPILSIAVDPGNTQVIYVGTSFGVFKSGNGAQTFADANTVTGGQDNVGNWTVQSLAMDPNNPRTIYAAVSNGAGQGRLFKTTNGADSWQAFGVTNEPFLTAVIDPRDSNVVYLGGPQGVTRSTNGGQSFAFANSGLPTDGTGTVLSIAVDGNDNSAIYAATFAGVFKSANRGDSWEAAGAGIDNATVRLVSADPLNARVVYAAKVNGGLYKTVDGGATWTPTSSFVGSDAIISRTSIVGAAGFSGGGVSPGEIVAIFGRNIGPSAGIEPGFDPGTGRLPTVVAGVRVFFGEHPAPLFFVRGDQINAQVPFEVTGLNEVPVRVVAGETESNRAVVPVLPSHPGVFDFISNQDLTRNSAANPEAPGNVIVLAVTGAGLLSPALTTGRPAPASPFSVPSMPVELTIGGQTAPIDFIGAAPGFVGLIQINARLPLGLAAGEHPVNLRVGQEVSQVPAKVHVR